MLKIGITGGIGSGKSTVAKLFAFLGIPIFNADDAAKHLMEHDASLKATLIKSFGTEIYKNDRLNRSFLSLLVFENPEKLKLLNSIVHPATIAFANEWFSKQDAPYCIKEAAIFFESGSAKEMDYMIGVYAPKKLRMKRAMQRDNTSEELIQKRMDQQMDEDEKMKLCDFVIFNDESQSLIQQVFLLNKQLIELNNKTN